MVADRAVVREHAATGEHRLAALICDPAHYDFAAVVRRQAGERNWARLQDGDPTLEADLAPMLAEPHARNGFQWHCEGLGQDRLDQFAFGWLTIPWGHVPPVRAAGSRGWRWWSSPP